MRRSCLPLLALACLLSAARAGEKKPPAGFKALYTGDLKGWTITGKDKKAWKAEKDMIVMSGGGGGWLMTEAEYGDFELRLEYELTKGSNRGVALRSPLKGDPAYLGMEIQIIDDDGYKGLKPWQYTGSIYGVVAPSKKATKPAGQWNAMRIVCKGRKVTVEVNGTKVVDADLDDYKKDFKAHPGLTRDKGHL